MEAERPPRLFVPRGCRDQRVAWSRTDAFADPIGQSHDENVPGRRCEGDQGSRDRRDEVAGEDERSLALCAIGDVPKCELEQTRGRVRRALDEAEKNGRSAERRQENGKKRKDHLRPDVGEEARKAKKDDGRRKARSHDQPSPELDPFAARSARCKTTASDF